MNLDCKICDGRADAEFKRKEVWSSERWRLTASRYSVVKGLCYLEPKSHIPCITGLDGEETKEFGAILRKVCNECKTGLHLCARRSHSSSTHSSLTSL